MEDTPLSEDENHPTSEEVKKPHTPENELLKFTAPIIKFINHNVIVLKLINQFYN